MNVIAPKHEHAYGSAEPALYPLDRPYSDATLVTAGGHKYPLHDSRAPWLGGLDIAGLVFAIAITLGPLAAYAAGLGA